MADDGPRILRPVPRRPFSLDLAAGRDGSSSSSSPPSPSSLNPSCPTSPRFLNGDMTAAESTAISRPQSFMNLTSSTLMGIYAQAAASGRDRDRDRDETDTPWGTGAQTPVVKRPSVDDATYELMRDRARRTHPRPPQTPASTPASLTLRAGLLFLLGVGYGVLVTRLHTEQRQPHPAGLAGWGYLACWGVLGVVLGSLLPWLDGVWEHAFGGELDGAADKGPVPDTDWALVMRAIGAFVGIVFAIRKLSWASTLQVSATLALVNPLLWWLIDRSKPGLLLSAAVGLAGSVLLLGVNPDMMPAPFRMSPHAGIGAAWNASSSTAAAAAAEGVSWPVLGGLASQQTVETGMWILSVLFCSCVCFGNIGRRLAWSRDAVGRGRWGGLR